MASHALTRITSRGTSGLASLTKPIATASMAMLLCERGKLSLDAPSPSCSRSFAASADLLQRGLREQVTVRMLLAHSSGLPAHRKLYLGLRSRGDPAGGAAGSAGGSPWSAPSTATSDSSCSASCWSTIAGEPLDCFCQREIFAPLNLNMSFIPQPLAPTQRFRPQSMTSAYRQRIVQGEVNDENASAMGGIAGHAGLFGDALSVARFAECLLRESAVGQPLFRPRPSSSSQPASLSRRELRAPSAGIRLRSHRSPERRFSARSFGHLGYTGTSLWCDPERGLSVTLLTNRTWPDSRNQAIKSCVHCCMTPLSTHSEPGDSRCPANARSNACETNPECVESSAAIHIS